MLKSSIFRLFLAIGILLIVVNVISWGVIEALSLVIFKVILGSLIGVIDILWTLSFVFWIKLELKLKDGHN